MTAVALRPGMVDTAVRLMSFPRAHSQSSQDASHATAEGRGAHGTHGPRKVRRRARRRGLTPRGGPGARHRGAGGARGEGHEREVCQLGCAGVCRVQGGGVRHGCMLFKLNDQRSLGYCQNLCVLGEFFLRAW